jgi:hypothetical protein
METLFCPRQVLGESKKYVLTLILPSKEYISTAVESISP